MPGKFESILIKMVAVEALQDPFFHMYSSGKKIYFDIYIRAIRRHQIFLGGFSDENEKVLGNFLAPPARKKRNSQIFRLHRAFFRCGAIENR